MGAGKYRDRITIEQPAGDSSRDGYGERTGSATTVATVWAEVQDMSGREFFEARKEGAEVSTRFTIRYRAGLDTSMQVLWQDVVYDIEAIVQPDNMRRELQLMCKAQVM